MIFSLNIILSNHFNEDIFGKTFSKYKLLKFFLYIFKTKIKHII